MSNGVDGSFSLTRGGPFYGLLGRMRVRSAPRFWMLGILIWLPMAFGEAIRIAYGMSIDPIVRDLSSHVRLLFGLPTMLLAERLLETCTHSAMKSFFVGRYCEREPVVHILDTAERLRDSWRIEAALLFVAVVGGQLALWGTFGGATGFVSASEATGFWSFPRVWYSAIALPVFQFVLLRWFWRWLIWTYVLVKISQLQLTPLATHPDLAAGLSCLSRPVTGFAGFVLANSGTLAAAWSTQVFMHGVHMKAVLPALTVFLVFASMVAFAPLFTFSGHLSRTRRLTLAQYGDFAREYMLDFHHKWIVRRDAESPLGTADIQSLNDIGGAFQVISKTRVVVFSPRTILMVWVAALVPMIPLFASSLTFEKVLERILRTVLGGLPF